MMGFVGHVLENVSGIQWYYIIGMFIFITLFIVMIYRTLKIPKSDLMDYKKTVLDNEEPPLNN
jgi:hypothetical protein